MYFLKMISSAYSLIFLSQKIIDNKEKLVPEPQDNIYDNFVFHNVDNDVSFDLVYFIFLNISIYPPNFNLHV